MLKKNFTLCFMKNVFGFLAVLIFCINASCNSADSTVKTKLYHVNYPVVGVLTAGMMVSDLFAISRIKGKAAISNEELNFLNTDAPNLLNRIDRWALKQKASDRKRYQQISDIGQIPIYLLPGLLSLDKNIRKDWTAVLLIYTEGFTTTFTFYNYSFLGPTFQNRYRPMAYYSEFSDDARQNGNNRNSFYSGHVASCAYSTFFMAKVYCDYHPDMGAAKYLWYIAATIPPVLMGYARIKALDHFPSDDAVGLALGAVIGIVIPQLHKYPCSKVLSLGMFTAPGGMGLNIRWNLPVQHFLAATR